jgi:ArsR family transcriptional regulator
MSSRQRAMVFKALGHRIRLGVVERLAQGECCVSKLREVTEMAGVSGPTVSQHLLVLRGAGLVTEEKRGTRVYYRLVVARVASIARWTEGFK